MGGAGEEVIEGEPLLELHTEDAGRFEPALAALEGAFDIAAEPPERRPLILEKIRP